MPTVNSPDSQTSKLSGSSYIWPFVAGSVFGLAIGFGAAGILGVAQPIWWGGEALVTPMMALIGLLVVGVPVHFLLLRIQRPVIGPSKRQSISTGLVWGIFFPFSIAALGRLLQIAPGWNEIPPLAALALGIALTSAILVVLSNAAFQIGFRRNDPSRN